MKIAFLSNYFNHHQKPFCEAMYKRLGEDFIFVATSEVSEWRKKLGYIEMTANYVQNYSEDLDAFINKCDVVIWGCAPYNLVKSRLREGKLTLFYSERIYRECIPWHKLLKHVLSHYYHYGRYKNFYMLCAGAYTAYDFSLTHCFKNKYFKWGYFPLTKIYEDINKLIDTKAKNNRLIETEVSILWVGRLIGLKHPEAPLYVAKRLKNDGVSFKLDIIGTGDLDNEVKESIVHDNLQDCAVFHGAKKADEVRIYMEHADIFLFTSDRNEGWGAVLNESMNSACAVVASDAIGAVPFLIKDGENGLVYHSCDWKDLYDKVKYLIDNPKERRQISEAAYQTIVCLWNAEKAAENLMEMISALRHGAETPIKEGPCSVATIIKG